MNDFQQQIKELSKDIIKDKVQTSRILRKLAKPTEKIQKTNTDLVRYIRGSYIEPIYADNSYWYFVRSAELNNLIDDFEFRTKSIENHFAWMDKKHMQYLEAINTN